MPETLKLDKESLSDLECRSEYIIKSDCELESNSNDQIYRLFGKLISKDPGFMRQWVRLFTITHRGYMTTLARNYLANSGLSLPEWCKGVKSGDKADVLVLFVLCVLTGTHCLVHLKQGYWTSLKDEPATHLEFIQHCNVHLSYLRNGIYAEHELHTVKATYDIFGLDQPFEIDETEPVVIGTLTSTENETLDKLMESTCIGNKKTVSLVTHDEDVKHNIKIGNESTLNIKPALNLIALEPDFTEDDSSELYTIPNIPDPAPINDNDLSRNDQREQEIQQIGITSTQDDDTTEKAAYSPATEMQDKGITELNKRKMNLRSKQSKSTHGEREHSKMVTKDIKNTSCKKIQKADLTRFELETRFNIKPVKVVLKKLSDKQIQCTVKSNNLSSIKKDTVIPRTATRQAKDIHTPAVLKKVEVGKTARFTFSKYSLPSKVKRKYKLKCIVTRCGRVFTTVRSLNQHHILKHHTVKYRCRISLKWSSTQSQLRNHMYTCMDKKFSCGRCNKRFTFQSNLNLHRNLHWHTKPYECFAKDCSWRYKWPQDLMRHIKMHLEVNIKCVLCNYRTHEKRLLLQHKNVHL